MVELPITLEPSLEAAEAEVERLYNEGESNRNYLGASEIGKACSRELWYSFRKVKKRYIKYAGIVAIEDGHAQEIVARDRLATVFQMSGEQSEVSLFSDHFKGHVDGLIQGVLEAPKSLHVWEHKSTNEKSFSKLLKLKEKNGVLESAEILKEWNPVYYAQAQIYMYLLDVRRHFLTVSTPGGRNWLSIRTRLKPKFAKGLIRKAKSIIFSDTPPIRPVDDRNSFFCKWCDYKEICWDGKTDNLQARCQNCIHAEPIEEEGAKWNCRMKQPINSLICRGKICKHHIFIPPIVPLEQTAAQTNENKELVSITYSSKKNVAGSGVFSEA